jgi:hypothetical protein
MPCSRISRITRKISRTRSGARPSEGSSMREQLRTRHQSAADREHLLLSAPAQGAGRLAPALLEPRKTA